MKALLVEGQHLEPEAPTISIEAIGGGIVTLVRRRILERGAASLPALAPTVTYFALAPFIGPSPATTVANSDRRRRVRASSPLPSMPVQVDPTKWTVLSLVSRWPVTAETLAAELDTPLAPVEEALEDLRVDNLVLQSTPEGCEEIRWTVPPEYRHLDLDDWRELPLQEREELMALGFRQNQEDIARATEEGTVNSRFDIHFSRLRVAVDERGWEELFEIHRSALAASQVVRMASARRLRESGGTPIYAASHQVLFEMPDADLGPSGRHGD